MEFVCPSCGLVIEASRYRGPFLLLAHTQGCRNMAAIPRTEAGQFRRFMDRMEQRAGREAQQVRSLASESLPINELRAIAQDLATGHKWRNTLTVEDAAFLHALEIDPT